MRLRFAFFLVIALTGCRTLHATDRPLLQDDFESPPAQNGVPTNWEMWGEDKDQIPANFTRDTTQHHGGQASFRIHHPAKTAAYILLSPNQAFKAEPGLIYTFTFWARTDQPGKALAKWTSYKTFTPFTDAPSPGSLTFDATLEWKEYTFSVREGLDFFATESPLLMPTFSAAVEEKEQRTLWVDDVRITTQPDPQPVGLINESTVPHEPLNHRLRPGPALDFTVDAEQRGPRAIRAVGGLAFHRVCGWTGSDISHPFDLQGKYTLSDKMETAIKDLYLPVTRFYALADESFGVEASLDKVAEVLARIGMPQEHCTLEFEIQGAEAMLPPDDWVRGVRHSLKKGYAFHRWEITNEPYSSLWGEGKAFPKPDVFIEHFQAVSRAIRKEDPQAKIGLDFQPFDMRWGNYVLKRLAGDYDFVAGHYYCHTSLRDHSFEEIVLTENYRTLDRALRASALVKAYNPGREVEQYDTEWGLAADGADGTDANREPRNGNIIGILHRAVRLIYYAREGILHAASGWNLLGPATPVHGFEALAPDAPDQRFMLYWLHYYFNRHVGAWTLPLEGTVPFYEPKAPADRASFDGPLTPVIATISEDGRGLAFIIANGSWTRSVPCRIHLRHFSPSSATAVVLSSNDLDASPLLSKTEDFVSALPVKTTADELTCTLPPHSVVFLKLLSPP